MKLRWAWLLSLTLAYPSSVLGQDVAETPTETPAAETPAAETPAGEAPTDDPSDAAARGHFESGRTAYAAGRFEEALSEFQQAFELSDRPALLYNIGASADRLSREAEALEAYEGFLARVAESELRPQVETRVAALRTELAEEAEREAAARAEGERTGAASAPRPPEVYEEWWFWTIIGGGVVAAALALGLGFGLARRSVDQPLPGDDGLVIQTLELGRF